MSRTLSTNSGSLESLKVSERCGCTLKAAHIRRTVVCDSPLSRAIERSDQWVASAGVVSSVRSMTRPPSRPRAFLGRPGRGSSESPSMRSFQEDGGATCDRVLVHAEFDCHRLIGQAVCAAQDHAAAIGQRARDPAASSLTFARLRRMVGGQHHKVGGRLLGAYAAHAAWLEDHRGQGNGALADRLIGGALAAPVSRTWKGYWRQRVA